MQIPDYTGEVPYLTAEQMVEVDRAMIEDYHIELIQMMENAGRNLAHLARDRFLNGEPAGRHVIVLAGTGGNGGGALVCARRLHNYGAQVSVFTTRSDDQFRAAPAHQLDILRRMQVKIASADEIDESDDADLVVDGVIGYSLKGAPRGTAARLIRWSLAQNASILALDAPSGVDATSGMALEPSVRATATMTLALPKAGLRAPAAQANVGELYLADISVPPALYAGPRLGLRVGNIFAGGDIVRLPWSHDGEA